MASPAQISRGNGPRKSILDLAPLELVCMNTLWPLGEGTVRQIQQRLAASQPRAYTTIMTIMDRLARKGVVARRKVGRAYLYRANLTAEEARAHAIEQVVEGFFEGSAEALATQLAGGGRIPARETARREHIAVARPAEPRIAEQSETAAPPEVDQSTEPAPVFPTTRLDESLL
jgi:predicted transcriptional regulator